MEKVTKIIKGKKLGMSQAFVAGGKVVPVTSVLIADEAEVDPSLEGTLVKVTGTSKGKGFTGVMKKWNFSGQQATRGQSNKPRAAGAIGSQTPGKVFKGKKMAGRHGGYKVTVSGLSVVKVLPDKKEMLISGPLPGARNSEVFIKVLGNGNES